MARTTYRWDAEAKDMIPLDEWYAKYGDHVGNSAMVLKPFEPFKSTIDGTIINDRKQLAAHNKRNGVTNIADYGEDHFKREGKRMYNERIGNTPQAERERREALVHNMRKAGIKI